MSTMNTSVRLLCKLGSIVVHIEEIRSPDGHQFDEAALDQLLKDREVVEWLREMRAASLIPEKRNG